MLVIILFIGLILAIVAIFIVLMLPIPPEIAKLITFSIVIATLPIVLLVNIIYKKNRDTLEQKAGDSLLSIREWIQDNSALTKVVIAWGLFITAVGFAQFVNDFGFFNSRELEMVSGNVNIIIAVRLISLALFSILNVYFIPSFVIRLGNNNGGFWVILIGFFGLILCGPLLFAGSGLGLGTMIFVMFTGIHMIVQSQRK